MPGMEPKKILLVEKDKDHRRTCAEEIASTGHFIIEADCGEEAIEKLRAVDVDLVVSEIDLPGMDGMTMFLAASRELPHLDKRRFIFMTGEGKRLFTLSKSTLNFLRKPLKKGELAGVVEDILSETYNTPIIAAPAAGEVSMVNYGTERRKDKRSFWEEDTRVSEAGAYNPLPFASTVDLSRGGLRIRYLGKPMKSRGTVKIQIRSLKIKGTARVMWSEDISPVESMSGLKLHMRVPLSTFSNVVRKCRPPRR